MWRFKELLPMPRWTRWGILMLGLVVLGTAPYWISNSYLLGVLILAYLYGVFASSWDFMSGQTGRENFGHALFVGAGAYTAAFLNVSYGVSPWWSLPAGGGVAVVFGLAIGLPTLRLRGPYFALATLAGATILQRLTVILWEQTGGEEGLSGLMPLVSSPVAFYYLTLGFMLVVAAVLVVLAYSRWGLLLRSIRGDEAAAQAAGVNTTLHKIGALLVSAFFAGMGGAFYAHYQLQVGPTLFSITVSITVIIMSYVGGIGSVYGALGGAFVLTLMTELLRSVGEYRLLFYTVVLIAILFFLPRGLIAPLWRRLGAGGSVS
jgi:branched-chain amino acid transport system permease protein